MQPLLCPSILNLPDDCLKKELKALDMAGVDIFPLDIIDGHYAENFGLSVHEIDLVRKCTSRPLDLHMMIERPGRYIDFFAEHGIDIFYIHPKTERIPGAVLKHIRDIGKKCGIAINPDESLEAYVELLRCVDYVLVMTVHPGFAGQSFLPFVEPKIEKLLALRKREDLPFQIVIDGGVEWDIMERLYGSGVDGFVLGKQTLLFQKEDYQTIVNRVREQYQKIEKTK